MNVDTLLSLAVIITPVMLVAFAFYMAITSKDRFTPNIDFSSSNTKRPKDASPIITDSAFTSAMDSDTSSSSCFGSDGGGAC